MPELIIHIGLPKTGTTTIQKRFFASLPNNVRNLTKDPCAGPDESTKLLSLFKQYCFDRIRPQELSFQMRKWVTRCIDSYFKHLEVKDHELLPLILSRESLSNWFSSGMHYSTPILTACPAIFRGFSSRRHPAPIVPFLSDYVLPQWPGEVKFILSLRNQPEWLASLYAQLSNRIRSATQNDFDMQIRRAVITQDPYLNWYEWYRALTGLVGHNKLHVLLLEEMNKPEYWANLSSFCGHPMPQENSVHENRKSDESTYWCVQPFSTIAFVDRYWDKTQFPNSRRVVIKAGSCVSQRLIDPIVRFTGFEKRDERVFLTNELRREILNRVSDSNVMLADAIAKDLQSLGYL